jgi:hypothetical protein
MCKQLISGLLFWCATAGLTLPQTTLAQDGQKSQLAASPNLIWKVSCHGTTTVPMTADAEQALPLQITAMLKCGEEITVLSDSQGYTVNVRAADGQTGYVAAMYLKKAPPARRTADPANLKNGVARWKAGTAGSEQFMGSDGSVVESLKVNGMTVQVSLRDTGWKYRANVALANGSSQPIDINPSKFILDNVGPHGKPLFYQDPAQLAKNMTHQALWTEADAAPATFQTRAESSLASSSGLLALGFKTSEPAGLPAQNYLLQHQTAEDEAIRNQGKQTLVSTAQQVRALALKPGTVQPNETLSGAVWFDRDKNPEQLILRIPVDDITFEFPLSFKTR